MMTFVELPKAVIDPIRSDWNLLFLRESHIDAVVLLRLRSGRGLGYRQL